MAEKNKMSTDEQIQKKVAYYSALVNAWIQSRMEVDKTLIIISSAGLGFLITIITTLGISNTAEFLIFFGAFISFFIVIVTCIIVFSKNAKYIENIIHNNKDELHLNKYDTIANIFFVLAIIFTLIIGVNYGLKQIINKGGIEMSEEKKKQIQIDESLGGLSKLAPTELKKKSLQGLDDLDPDKIIISGDSSSTDQDTSSDSED